MCNCITDIESKLDGQSLAVAFTLRGNQLLARPVIGLFRKDKGIIENRRGKPRHMVPSFCPWCGVRYADEPVEVAA